MIPRPPRRTAWCWFLLLTAACDPSAREPGPPNGFAFAFAVFGDGPYNRAELRRFDQLIEQVNADQLAFLLHVGDILGSSCSDAAYLDRRARLRRVRHPVVYTPGDNEWTDCHEASAGSYRPLERLARLRELFFADTVGGLGGDTLPLMRQRTDPRYAEFPENVRWTMGGLVFATMHIVGSRNATRPFAGRTAADDEEGVRRTAAAIAWLRETFAVARTAETRAVVIGIHGNPRFDRAPAERRAYDDFLAALEDEVAAFGRPVLFVHGDTHTHRVDHPLVHRASGQVLENFTRLETYGSPDIGWVRVVVDTLGPQLFRYEPRRIRRLGLW